ncbi:MAG: ATP-binding protein [Patescibacteria group bacterium]|nr:ATP-binding protein [Patescibacteria group bacterium]
MQINQNITKNISLYNPWYQDKDFLFLEKKYNKRKQYYAVEKYLDKELIISIVGLRRTGKTTIIKQIINSLLKKAVPEQIFFYQFDEENFDLEAKLDFYFQNILKQDIYKANCYIFLDELQNVSNWQVVLKKYYDINKKIKFVVSGSTHLYLHKNTKESLAGRIINIDIHPFGWYEFLNFKYGKNYDFFKNIFDDNFLEIAKDNRDILLYKKDFKTFLSYGEYPYFFHEANAFELDKYFKDSILDKIFARDINLFDIDNHNAFFQLFKVLNKDSAQEINLQNISREIGLNVITIKRYINILEKMFLYHYIYKYTKSVRQQIKSFKKGYVASLNLLRVSLNIDYLNMYDEQYGHIIETFVCNEMIKNGVNNINFYNNTKIKKEVDFVITNGKKIIPIEVKISERINNAYLKNLAYFMESNKTSDGILIYGGDEIKTIKINKLKIECLPYFMV